MRDRDDHFFVGDQVFERDLALVTRDLGATVIPIRLNDLREFVLHHLHAHRLRVEQRGEFLDEGADFLEFLLKLADLEAGELREAHVEDRLGLLLTQLETPLQFLRSALGVVGGADDLDDRIDVVDGDLEAIEDVLALTRLVDVELRPPDDDFVPVVDEVQ